jgi:hypothetical protein
MNERQLPKSKVGKIENPVLTINPSGVIRMSVGDAVNVTGTIGLVSKPDWEIEAFDGPIEVHEVDTEGRAGRHYDVTAIGIGEARVTFIDKKSGTTSDTRIAIS